MRSKTRGKRGLVLTSCHAPFAECAKGCGTHERPLLACAGRVGHPPSLVTRKEDSAACFPCVTLEHNLPASRVYVLLGISGNDSSRLTVPKISCICANRNGPSASPGRRPVSGPIIR